MNTDFEYRVLDVVRSIYSVPFLCDEVPRSINHHDCANSQNHRRGRIRIVHAGKSVQFFETIAEDLEHNFR